MSKNYRVAIAGATGAVGVEFLRCRELRAAVVGSRQIACQADGELVGNLPATFSMHARGLRCVTGRRA